MLNLFKKNKQILEEKNKELLNYIKTIVYKFSNNEIEINQEDIKRAERMELYVEDSYMKFAKRLKVISKNNYMKEK